MGHVREINIAYRTYYFFNGKINIEIFDPNLLKISKKSYKTLIVITLDTSQSKTSMIIKIFRVKSFASDNW